jgi:hypothetical protein
MRWQLDLDREHDIADALAETNYPTPTGTIAAVVEMAVKLGIVEPTDSVDWEKVRLDFQAEMEARENPK